MTMHYPQWNYVTVPSFIFRCVTVSELRFFKRKTENLQNGLLLINTFLMHQIIYRLDAKSREIRDLESQGP